jgi:hypothetical protein
MKELAFAMCTFSLSLAMVTFSFGSILS